MSLVSVNNISFFYQDGKQQRFILKDISCEFEKGKLYTILGAFDSGKKTLLSVLSALDRPHLGGIFYEGKSVKEIGLTKYRRDKVGIILQSNNLIPYMTGVENLLVAMGITDNELPLNHKEVACNLLDYIGIGEKKVNQKVTTLSKGEQQKVAIARALSTNADLILADEPTRNLSEETAEGIFEILKCLAHIHGKCVIVASQSEYIASISDVVFKLSKGALTVDE